jgi:hypothetical protein
MKRINGVRGRNGHIDWFYAWLPSLPIPLARKAIEEGGDHGCIGGSYFVNVVGALALIKDQ